MTTQLKYNLFFSSIIAVLLSVSPALMLLEHHTWGDIADKILLLLTAFMIAYANLVFYNNIHEQSIPVFKWLILAVILNLFLFGIDLLIRVPFWNFVETHRPPVFVLLHLDFVRSIIIGIVSYFLVAFLAKNKAYHYNTLKIKNLENQSLQLQLKSLTAQLQPHFFFNSLNVLSELIQTDVKKSDEYIQQLSQFFRYVLSTQQNHFVSLHDEIRFINTYIYLLKIRFENAITVNFSIRNHSEYSIPSLCTLIVLENIVKHNNISAMQIDISISEEEKFLKISNAVNKKKSIEVNSLGYGLENINKKCELLLHKSIRISEDTHTFAVEIPLAATEKI